MPKIKKKGLDKSTKTRTASKKIKSSLEKKNSIPPIISHAAIKIGAIGK